MGKRFERTGQSKENERHFLQSAGIYTIYVEGNEDTLFWKKIFPLINGQIPVCQILTNEDGTPLCGENALLKYLEKCIADSKKINFIVAIDGDYHSIIKHKPDYPNLIKTDRYAIENYIFCFKSISEYIKKLSYDTVDIEDKIKYYYDYLATHYKDLIILDCINSKNKLGKQIFNKDIIKFFRSKKRLQEYISSFKMKTLANKENLQIKDEKAINFLRMKFFIPKIGELIKRKTNKEIAKINHLRGGIGTIGIVRHNLGTDALYTECIYSCAYCNNPCQDYKNLKTKAFIAAAMLCKNGYFTLKAA